MAVRNARLISRIGPPLLLAVIVYCSYSVVLELCAKPTGWVRSDYLMHALTARDWWRGRGLRTPHFLFEGLIIACHLLFSTSDVLQTALAVAGASAVAAAWVTYAFWIRELPTEKDRDYWVAALWSLGLQVVGPITMATIWASSFYLGYIYPASTYHNPTIVLLKPLALLSFILTLRALERSMTGGPGWQFVLGLCVAGILSALAKPNWLLCFLPGVMLTVLFDARLRCRPAAWCVAGAAILSGLSVLAWQYAFLYGHSPADQIIITPLKWITRYGWMAPLKLMLSVAYPVSVLALFWKDVRNSLLLALAWSTFAISLLIAYGFSETGTRAGDDNLGWSAQIALFVLFIASAISMVGVLRQRGTIGRGLRFRRDLAIVIFLLHVVGGITFYATYWMIGA